MKPALSFLLLVLITICGKAQTKFTYFNSDYNVVTDTSQASYKILFTKNSEDTTLWSVSQFTMSNVLMMEGVYKDKTLSTPHGEFKYYNFKGGNHYMKSSGYFFNGIKYGPWIEYYPNGRKKSLTTLRNDELNGPFAMFPENDTIPTTKGQFLKGRKEGEWITPNFIEYYSNGIRSNSIARKSPAKIALERKELRDSLNVMRHFVEAKPSKEFVSYMRKKLDFYFSAHRFEVGITGIAIIFTVGQDGKLSNGELQAKDSYKYEDRVDDIIKGAPAWQPATLNGNAVTERITYTFSEDKATTKMPE